MSEMVGNVTEYHECQKPDMALLGTHGVKDKGLNRNIIFLPRRGLWINIREK